MNNACIRADFFGEYTYKTIKTIIERKLDYTVIGDEVNTAQRLQSAAKEGQILISEKSYEQIKESFQCKKVGEVNLKNKENPVVAYEVIE